MIPAYEVELTDIAIIGMSGRFPEAKNIKEFWNNLKKGKESVQKFTKEEMFNEGVPVNLIDKQEYINVGTVLENIDQFDAEFFGFTPYEAKITDPQHRIFLECVWEALEDSGYSPEKFNGLIGLYGSSSMSSYMLKNLIHNKEISGDELNYHLLIGNDKDYLCSRVSYKLNLKGPSISVQTACSSSLVAVHLACQSLINHECDMAIAGGVSISVPQKSGYLYKEGGIMSRDGHCRTFDDFASGIVKGNGCGVIVLKSLDKAIRDNDNIYAVIKSTAINNDGSDKIGFTAPGVSGQAQVIRDAVTLAGVDPNEIGYIEAHGTGTSLGDPVEIEALSKAFCSSHKQFCAVGSLKPNVGHLDAAAGAAGVIKTALILKEQVIPPSINFRKQNKQINFNESPFYINQRLSPKSDLTYAGVSSFGLGGTNAHLVLKRPPIKPEKNITENKTNLYIFSAKKESTIYKICQNIKGFLEGEEVPRLDDIAYTLSGRSEFNYRYFIIASDLNELILELLNVKDIKEVNPSHTEIAFRLGYNSKYFSALLENNSEFKKIVKQLLSYLESKLNINIPPVKLIEQVNDQVVMFLSHFIYNYSLSKLLMAMGISPGLIIPRNTVDELVSLSINEIIPVEDALGLITQKMKLSIDMIKKSGSILLSSGRILNNLSTAEIIHAVENLDLSTSEQLFYIPEKYEIIDFKDLTLASLPEKTAKKAAYAAFLEVVGLLWARGISIQWNKLFNTESLHKVSLPTYPFSKKRYWIEPDTGEKSVLKISDNYSGRVADKVISIWKNRLAVENIELDDYFYDLGGDSLAAVEIVSQIKNVFNISISLDDFMKLATPGKIVDYINYYNRNLQSNFLDQRVLIKIKEGKSLTPLFLIHPAGGTIVCYYDLVRYLPDNTTIYGLQFPEDKINNGNLSLRNLASEYISEIKKVQGDGPYRIGGYSFGGNVAFEMALQLEESGEEVTDIIMFDSHVPEAYYGEAASEEDFIQAFPLIIDMFIKKKNIDLNKLSNFKNKTLDQIIDFLKKENEMLKIDREDYLKFFMIWKNNHTSLKQYLPNKRFSGNILFFSAKDVEANEVLDLLNIKPVEKKAWENHIQGKIFIIQVPGDHYSMFGDKGNIQVLAKELKNFI